MKKLYLPLILISLVGLSAFGETGEQEEIGFLLFLPNSGNEFVNVEQAMIQLENMASYLMTRNLSPGQISVYGYAAASVNDIDAVKLSRDRASYVMEELQKRGLREELFTEPVAYGSVDLWGASAAEEDRSLNRRVRILLDNNVLVHATLQSEITEAGIINSTKARSVIWDDPAKGKAKIKFLWWLIPLALLALWLLSAIILFATGTGRRPMKIIVKETTPLKHIHQRSAITAVPLASQSPKIYILTEEEIRRNAYGLYKLCGEKDGDAVEDWHRSIHELTAYYETQGYQVKLYWEAQEKMAS